MTTAARLAESDLGYLLGQASHALYAGFDIHVRAAGLTAIEWRVLATLQNGAALPVSTLAREVLCQQPTVTKLVQRMRIQGWLSLQADPTDQRRTLVAATPAGRDKVLPLLKQARQHEMQILRSLSPVEVHGLKTLLARLARRN